MSAKPPLVSNIKIYLRKFGKIIVTALLVAATSIGIAIAISKIFTIETIELRGTGVQVAVDQKKIAKNLLFFPVRQLRESLLSENPLLAEVSIQKKYPHTLVITTFPRTPAVRLQSNGRIVDIDKEGIILGESHPSLVLPVLVFDVTPLRIGEKLHDQNIVTSLAVIDAFASFLPVDSITTMDSESLQVKSGRLYIYITQKENIAEATTTLQTLLNGFRIKGTMPASIDLRFAKPVVLF